VFFGVDETSEEEQHARWLDRRKRLAARRYGSLKEEYLRSPTSPRSPRVAAVRQLQLTSAYATQASVSVTVQLDLCVLFQCSSSNGNPRPPSRPH
jgi:hypothetical protein